MAFGFGGLGAPSYLGPEDLARLRQQPGFAGRLPGPQPGLGGPSEADLARALAGNVAGAPIGFGGPPTVGLPEGALSQAIPAIGQRPFGFGQPGLPLPQTVRLPPSRPSPADLSVIGSEAQVPPDRSAPALNGGGRRVPLTPRSQEQAAAVPDVPASGAAPVQPQPARAANESSMLDRIMGAIGQSGDLLTNVGIGLMSTPGFGPGVAAGLRMHQEGEPRRAAVSKLRREQQAENETEAFLRRGGFDQAMARGIVASAAAGDRTALSNALARLSPRPIEAPSGYTMNPATGQASFISGGPADPAVIGAQTRARSEPQLIDMPQPDGSTRKVWLDRGEVTGTPVGAATMPVPNVRELTGPDGVKRPYQLDRSSGQWVEMAVPGSQGAGGNPYADGRFNDGQGKAAGFADRLMAAEQVLRGYNGVPGVDQTNTTPVLSNIAGSDYFPNALKSDDRQRLEQAQRNFVNAQLRRESGAVISQDEFNNARVQYFPQPGDGPQVQAQKRLARQQAIEAMGREGGPAYRPGFMFDRDGGIVPYRPATPMAGKPSRQELEAEARRRGLMR